MSNHLADQNSPYLLQHKDNPVDWYPWGETALSRAKAENKPIFLSIGYAACHWCHVMEHESFEDPEIAALMNSNFINIKVDREERPDLDGIYMDAVVAITGQGGWPMSVFLTPEGKPFYAGTYFPPTRRYGMPSFREVLEHITRLWREKQNELEESGQKIAGYILAKSKSPAPGSASELSPEYLQEATFKLAKNYDWEHGGWGAAPKFPQPMAILYLLRQASRGDNQALEIATHALDAMSKGGMWDVIGGGFARYSVDHDWLVPHFEKMLYDNAQLARAYMHAYLLTKNEIYRQVCEQTLDFILAEMSHTEGGFYSSIDADSEGEEGKFYLWRMDEVRAALKDDKLSDIFTLAYTLTEGGNFEGRNILQRKRNDTEIAEKLSLSAEEVSEQLARSRELLYQFRNQRIRPATDDKILTAWNAWMSTTFAEAARYLDRPDYLLAAQRNLNFILTELYQEGKLLRSWRAGKAQHNAYLEDYAGLALALLALYQSDHNPRWFEAAQRLTVEIIAGFYHPQRGFFDTRHDHEKLLFRPQDAQDNATPSGSSLAVQALLLMAAYLGENDLYNAAAQTLASMQDILAEYPAAFSSWLAALDLALTPLKEIALLGDLESLAGQALIQIIWSQFRPDVILAASTFPPDKVSPPLLRNRPLVDGQPTAYVCRQFTCQAPTTSADELVKQLQSG